MTDSTETEPTVETDSKLDNEAKKYRLRLREAEAERDTFKTTVEALSKQLVEAHLPRNVKPDVFWKMVEGSPSGFIGDDGLDTDRVQEEAKRVSTTLGLPDPARGPVVPSQRGGEVKDRAIKNSFESAFAPRDE